MNEFVETAIDDPEEDEYMEKDNDHPGKAKVRIFRSMSDMILIRYMQNILEEINRKLEDGQLSRILGFPVLTEKIEADGIHITGMQHYDINKTDMETDIRLWMELDYMDHGKETDAEFDLGLTLDISFLGEWHCEVASIWDLDDAPDRGGYRSMDGYLNPCMSTEQKESAGRYMWLDYTKDGLECAGHRTPEALAEGMGVDLMQVNSREPFSSRLYFAGNAISVAGPEGAEKIVLERDTIVMNITAEGVALSDDLELYRHLARYGYRIYGPGN